MSKSRIPAESHLQFLRCSRIEILKLKMSDLYCPQAQRVLVRIPPAQIQLWSRSALYLDWAVETVKVIRRD